MLRRMFLAVVVAALFLLDIANADGLDVGGEFPAWALVDQHGATVTSVGYAGRSYVLWFYPAAMSPGCTAEGRGFRDNLGGFEQAGVEVLGVSFDPPEVNDTFAKAEEFPFPLLSDTERKLAREVGAMASADNPRPRRITFVVGRDGNVVKVYENFDPLRHAAEILLDLGVPIQ